jgi:hypothetical protein
MRRLRKLVRLSPSERGLFWRAALWVGAVRLGLWLLPFQTLRRMLARAMFASHTPLSISPPQIARAVTVTSRYVPRATCLTQALAAQVLLEQYGYTSQLRLGVAKNERGFEAHAWVEYQGKVVIGGAEHKNFTPLPPLDAERP